MYNLGGGEPRSNLVLLGELLQIMGAPEEALRHVPDRPGHDQRYGMDGSRAHTELGWRPQTTLSESLPAVVAWYRDHRARWWGADGVPGP